MLASLTVRNKHIRRCSSKSVAIGIDRFCCKMCSNGACSFYFENGLWRVNVTRDFDVRNGRDIVLVFLWWGGSNIVHLQGLHKGSAGWSGKYEIIVAPSCTRRVVRLQDGYHHDGGRQPHPRPGRFYLSRAARVHDT